MSDVEEIRIVSNKIDRLEDFALPSQNSVKSLILEGNYIYPRSALAVCTAANTCGKSDGSQEPFSV